MWMRTQKNVGSRKSSERGLSKDWEVTPSVVETQVSGRRFRDSVSDGTQTRRRHQ